jgi:hypothetical protein
MVQRSRFWDGTTLGDATVAPYDAGTEFSEVMTAVAGMSLTPNKGGMLTPVVMSTPSAGTYRLAPFEAIVYGTWYQNDADVDVVIPTPSAATRIDLIVLRKSWTAQTVRIVTITGTEGGSAPALVQTPGVTWDVPIASVSTTTGGVGTVTGTWTRADLWYRVGPFTDKIKTSDRTVLVGAPSVETIGWHPDRYGLQIGRAASIVAPGGTGGLWIRDNGYVLPTSGIDVALWDGPSARISMEGTGSTMFQYAPTPQVGSGGQQIYQNVFSIGNNVIQTHGLNNVFQMNTGGRIYLARADNGASHGWRYHTAFDALEHVWQGGPTGMWIDYAGGISVGGAGQMWVGSTKLQVHQARTVFNLGKSTFPSGDWVYLRDNDNPSYAGYMGIPNYGDIILYSLAAGQRIMFHSTGGIFAPVLDAQTNLGYVNNRWYALYASIGTIQTCHIDAKDVNSFVALDNSEALAALRNTSLWQFDYKPPKVDEIEPYPDMIDADDDDERTRISKRQQREEHALAVREQLSRQAAENVNLYKSRRGIIIGSPDHPVDPYFHMKDGQSADAMSFASSVAAALKGYMEETEARLRKLEGN